MTITTFNLENLKKVKNSVIGNPSAKVQLAQDDLFVRTLVECLNHQPPDPSSKSSQDSLRTEAAHVISSLSYGSEQALTTLLRSDAPNAFLYAISNFQPSDPVTLRSAFARALRALTVSIAETVGPSQWGLKRDHSVIKGEATEALESLFRVESLDVYLPLLVDTSPQTSTSIAQLLASSVRTKEHRKAITEWLPPPDRLKEVKTKRGWEKAATSNTNAQTKQGGWAARNLTALLRSRDSKLQEAALSGLASLAKDNPMVSSILAKSSTDREIPSALSTVMSLTKSKFTDVQLAACLCATHILRASTPNVSAPDETSVRTIINIINRMISVSSTESSQVRIKACFVLYYLVTDHAGLCHWAFDRGALDNLAALVQSITPTTTDSEWEEDEAESVSCLREAGLTAIAAICLFDNDIRRAVTDDLHLLPTIHTSLTHRHVGIRYAACQCVRALSRAVAVLRTNIVDSGLGMTVFGIFKKEDEDRRVSSAALSAVCNIVNEFSPLRPIFLEQGLMPRILQLVDSGDPTLRLSALWAVKNLLRKTSSETKRDVMNHLGWQNLAELLVDVEHPVKEQAFNIVRNLAENEQGINMVFRELGADVLLTRLTTALGSTDEDVVLQAAYALANLTNGYESHQNLIIAHPQMMNTLRSCLAESKPEIRRPAVACVLELSRSKGRKELVDAGMVSTLRHICEWGSAPRASSGSARTGVVGGGAGVGGVGSVGAGGAGVVSQAHVGTPLEDDKDVVDQARMALDWLEHGDVYSP